MTAESDTPETDMNLFSPRQFADDAQVCTAGHARHLERRLTAQAERIATLREIHASHESGRCYPCGWPLKASIEEGCVIGNCSYRPSERAPDYEQWRERTDKARAALSAEDRHDD